MTSVPAQAVRNNLARNAHTRQSAATMCARLTNRAVMYRSMRASDLRAVLAMLDQCEGIGRRSADSPAALKRFLARNPRLSVVATVADAVVGCVFVGHDGRRGYLHHVAVDPDHRRRGIGRRIVDLALARLLALGIEKVHCDVFQTNRRAQRFWAQAGWQRRSDIVRYSIVVSDDPNA